MIVAGVAGRSWRSGGVRAASSAAQSLLAPHAGAARGRWAVAPSWDARRRALSAQSGAEDDAGRGAEAGGRKPRVLVLGSGWGGFALARRLNQADMDVHMLSARNHMVFTPLLASTAVGTLEFRGIAEPARSSLKGVHFHLGKCRGVDLEGRTVRVVTKGAGAEESRAVRKGTIDIREYDLPFDVLVLAVGARNNTFGIPGVEEHVHFLKELTDARRIRKGIIQCLEAASDPDLDPAERDRLLHFVVVGGGPTGTEFSAELHDFLDQDAARYFPEVASHARVTLIEGREILGSFSESLRRYATNRFKKLHINIRTGANVQEVTARHVLLDDGDSVPYGMCVWSTGVGPRRVTQLLDPAVFAKEDRTGKIAVDERLCVKSGSGEGVVGGVYALGDCAAVEGKNYATIAQVAERQGKVRCGPHRSFRSL